MLLDESIMMNTVRGCHDLIEAMVPWPAMKRQPTFQAYTKTSRLLVSLAGLVRPRCADVHAIFVRR